MSKSILEQWDYKWRIQTEGTRDSIAEVWSSGIKIKIKDNHKSLKEKSNDQGLRIRTR